MMLHVLQDLTFRLNGVLLCSDATDTSYEGGFRKRKRCEDWVQEQREKMNAFYAGESDTFPNFVISAGDEFMDTRCYITDAWVKSTRDRMNLFYTDSENQIPFPSLRPPKCVAENAQEIELATSGVYEYYDRGMPWPGYWAFDEIQLLVFGTPRDFEVEFRETISGKDRSFVGHDYLEKLTSEFQSVQNNISQGISSFISTDVIEFWINIVTATKKFSISMIKVRPCLQKRGLLTVFLYIVVEACIASEKFALGVSKAIQFSQDLFLKYGFKKIEGEDPYRVDMELRGEDAMRSALEILRNTAAVKKLGKSDNGKYYLDKTHFPTADELKNPEYVQALFPKPNTPPPRLAPDQLLGYVAPPKEA